MDFAQVTGGEGFSCALRTSGAAVCWGTEQDGQVGRGTSGEDSTLPVSVTGGIIFSTISAGGEHVCGLATTSTNGNVWCWGSSRFGQAAVTQANDDCGLYSNCAESPFHVNLDLVTISSGTYHTCGVTAAGAAYCWGSNLFGELGAGPLPLTCYIGSGISCSPTPLPVSGGLTFKSVSAGNLHTCGVTTTDQAYCWGWNDFGQLGTGNQAASDVPLPVTGLPSVSQVATGDAHSCALTAGGEAYCWGSNQYGELGVAQNGESCTSQAGSLSCRKVSTIILTTLRFTTLQLGVFATCGLDTTGLGYCWGLNLYGQLGANAGFSSIAPVEIDGQR